MDRFFWEITSYYQGHTQTNKVVAETAQEAVSLLTAKWVKGVEILKVEKYSCNPVKTGTPKVC